MKKQRRSILLLGVLAVIVLVGTLLSFEILFPKESLSTDRTTPVYSNDETVRFAIIGDYGLSGDPEADVAEMVKSWGVDFIVTVGDNNYSKLAPLTMEENLGQYYGEFIGGYGGDDEQSNRFFPALGNHDWNFIICETQPCRGAYFDYFSLPGNERYYDFIWGPIHFFILDSDEREPDGISPDSLQGRWLEDHLKNSISEWNVVIAHHPPYSSGERGPTPYMAWPYKEWGADLLLSGHSHTYERLIVDDFTYIINGLGGKSIHEFEDALPTENIRYNDDYGAMLVDVTKTTMNFQFIARTAEEIDSFALQH